MILFVFHHLDAARHAGFHNGKHSADPEMRGWYPGADLDQLRGLQFSRVFTVDYPPLTRRDVDTIRAQLRVQPALWIDL